MSSAYDCILVVSFGGPEGPDEVLPFLENVLRGKNVPRERMLEVAEHYQHFGGVSPINAQNRALIAALAAELQAHQLSLPIYWGNRNWRPLLTETLTQMQADGRTQALAFVTSAFSSYSGCRQYREDLERARQVVGAGAPRIDKLRSCFNHPGFIEPMAERVRSALQQIPGERRAAAQLAFTAHSIPLAMARGCQYENQLKEAARLVANLVGRKTWELVYQSRSGPPSQPWLEPDVGDYLRRVARTDQTIDVVLVPIGFISDHMEVLYDLDTEARELSQSLGINLVRAATVGTHPRFVTMIRELIEERLAEQPQRLALGDLGPTLDVCPADCCPSGRPSNVEPRSAAAP